MFGSDIDFDNDFDLKWMRIEPCNSKQADCIMMKLKQQRKRCNACKNCIGEKCDIFVTAEEEAGLGKYLIEQKIK